MARKDVVLSQIAASQSLSSSFNSSPTIVRYLDNVAYQINITTTNSTGSFKIQASLDYAINEISGAPVNPGNWVDLVVAGVAAAANDQILVNLNQLPFNAIRVVYTSSVAGTGTCDIYLMARQVGG